MDRDRTNLTDGTEVEAPSAGGGGGGRQVTRFVPWFGSNAKNAARPAEVLKGCRWVYIPFVGSGCEIRHFDASVQIMCSDKHDELIALYRTVKDPIDRVNLQNALSNLLFHPRELEDAKAVLARARGEGSLFGALQKAGEVKRTEIALAYFTVCWMGRSSVAGTRHEADVNLALRYDAGGGDPVKRWGSALRALADWEKAFFRCSFTREDVFDVLDRIEIKEKNVDAGAVGAVEVVGVYCDPPWPDDGDRYLHTFKHADQVKLAARLSKLENAHVCVRFGEHPLIRELYREADGWIWHEEKGRDQHRQEKAEVFLERRPGGRT